MSASLAFKASEAVKDSKADFSLKRKVTNSESLPIVRVKEKLRKIEGFQGVDEEALKAEVDKCIDPETIAEVFSHLYDPEPMLNPVLEEAEAFSDGFQTSVERRHSEETADHRHKKAAHLPVYLFFSKLQCLEEKGKFMGGVGRYIGRLACKHGPLHAALMVGDVIVEWGKTSLILPQRKDAFKPVFRIGVQKRPHSYWLETVSKMRSEMLVRSGGLIHYGEQVGHLIDIHIERKKLIDELIRTIVKYNKFFHYHVFARNCQHFVADAMEALGLATTIDLKGHMREYYESLRTSKAIGTPSEFETHTDLDHYVMNHLVSLSSEQLQYMYCQYLCFHETAGMEEPSEFQCAEITCRFLVLEDHLEKMDQDALLQDTDIPDAGEANNTATP